MRARIKVDELPAFDAAPCLDSDEAIAAYLTDILQANDAGLLSAALGDIARARGMTDIAKAAGITREALYKALRPGSAPRFDTVNRVCIALGVRLGCSLCIRSDLTDRPRRLANCWRWQTPSRCSDSHGRRVSPSPNASASTSASRSTAPSACRRSKVASPRAARANCTAPACAAASLDSRSPTRALAASA